MYDRPIYYNSGNARKMDSIFKEWKGQIRGRTGTFYAFVRGLWVEGKLSLILTKPVEVSKGKILKKYKLSEGQDILDTMDEIGKEWGCPNVTDCQFAQPVDGLSGRYSHIGHYLRVKCTDAKGKKTPTLCCRVSKDGKFIHVEEHPYDTCTRWGRDD